MQVRIAFPGTQLWNQAVDLAKLKYRERFNAEIEPAPDYFFVCQDDSLGIVAPELLACVGITAANGRRLFSEIYLDDPIDHIIQERYGRPVDRSAVIEVGTLAAQRAAGALELVRALPILTWCMGTRYVLTTSTEGVRNICRKAGIEFTPICAADPSRLNDSLRSVWGNYYEQDPITGYLCMSELSASFFPSNVGKYNMPAIALDVVRTQAM